MKAFQRKLNEKVQEILDKDVNKSQFVEIETEEIEVGIKDEPISEQFVIIEEPQYIEEYEEVSLPQEELYEEVEFLESEMPVIEDQPAAEKIQSSQKNSSIHSKLLCTLCEPSIAFKYEKSYLKHIVEYHQSDELNARNCQVCNFPFENLLGSEECIRKVITKHLKSHEEGKIYPCMECADLFKSHRALEIHQARQHFNLKTLIVCKGCQCEFATNQELKDHLSVSNCRENHERGFKCYICNEIFSMGIEKKKHIQTLHQDKAGSDCPLCIRCKIPSAVAFENHYKTHFAEPRFHCSFCDRSFYESDRLHTHIRRAHLNTKLSCNWCDKTFRDKSGIARHILGVHFNQRNHKCKICSKAFSASYNLTEHMFSVHKQASKFYTCKTCSQNFLYRKQYERHRKTCYGVPERRRR